MSGCLFEDKRPVGVIIRNTCIKRALKKVEKNKDLTDQVAKIRHGEQEDETWQQQDKNWEKVKIKGEANMVFLELFHTSQLHPLKLSTIFDLKTTLHIFNDLSHFYNFKKVPKHKYVIASNSEVPILDYSNVAVQVTRPDKSKGILCLKDIAFCTDFNTNLVSFCLLQKWGYYWDNKRDNNCLV